MFRKGGDVEEGIMELATPRRNYKDGKTREEMIQEIFETSGLTESGKSYAETAILTATLLASSPTTSLPKAFCTSFVIAAMVLDS